MKASFSVAVVGAGPSGIGAAIALKRCGIEDVVVLERECIGAAPRAWPAEMRFITPSFPSNGFGQTDLNSIAPELSVALDTGREHPSGADYVAHLERAAEAFELSIQTGVEVSSVAPLEDEGFELSTSQGPVRARFVVWAAGEFFYPREAPFEGAHLCRHTSRLSAYSELEGDDFTLIGGYESGIDAAINLTLGGRRARVLDASAAWEAFDFDPSLTLSPYTVERLNQASETGRLELIGSARVSLVREEDEGFVVCAEDGRQWFSVTRPLLATGFEGSLRLISGLFDWSERGHAQLSSLDESLKTPGLFVCGPMLRHANPEGETLIFCFIYKFRMRFMVVAARIAQLLGADPEAIEDAQNYSAVKGMLLEDLSCCDTECGC